ncbi:MAG: hypothetical protein B6I28_00380 [Fusobacteriia bacterium 4572_132]|nr:MAG: hypothetical protein B6I28_00380 [Fusobacteriia bacterium 4572_132]
MNKFFREKNGVKTRIETEDIDFFKQIVNKIMGNKNEIIKTEKKVTIDNFEMKKKITQDTFETEKITKEKDVFNNFKRLPNEKTVELDPDDPDVIDLSKMNIKTKKTIKTKNFECPQCHQTHSLILYDEDDNPSKLFFSYPFVDGKEDAEPLYLIDVFPDYKSLFDYSNKRGFEYINMFFSIINDMPSLEKNVSIIPGEEKCSCPICEHKGTTQEFYEAYKYHDDNLCPLCGNEGLLLLGNNVKGDYKYECEFCSEIGEPYYF